MAQQPIFFKKNKADYTDPAVVATATEGSAYAHYILNRSNNSAWVTTGSVDANNTQLTVDFGNFHSLTDILLVKHNFKAFHVEYWNGSAWTDFSPAINPTNVTSETNRYTFAKIDTSKIRITISGTQTPNTDKYLYQLIATELLGQIEAWPEIKNPKFDKNKRNSKMLSGKLLVADNVGAFSVRLSLPYWKSANDLALLETIFEGAEGVLLWLCGGDASQFSSVRMGYRLEDLFLVRPTNAYEPEWFKNIYKAGLDIAIDLAEVTL